MEGKKHKIGAARQSFAFCFILVIIEHKGWHATNPLIISLLIEFSRDTQSCCRKIPHYLFQYS